MMFGKEPCSHKWKLIDRTLLPSGYEQILSGNTAPTKLTGLDEWIFKKRLIFTFQCETCTEVDQKVQVNP